MLTVDLADKLLQEHNAGPSILRNVLRRWLPPQPPVCHVCTLTPCCNLLPAHLSL